MVKEFLKKIKLNEGNISLAVGVTVMLVAGIMLISYFRTINKIDKQESRITSASSEITPTPEASIGDVINPLTSVTDNVEATISQGSEYTVSTGDSLWKIAKLAYGDGKIWVKIYETNKGTIGTNPSLLRPGAKLYIPKLDTPSVLVLVDYTVVTGDNLWNIAQNLCGSGFGYPTVARDNAIANPSLIHPGQIIKVKCPARI